MVTFLITSVVILGIVAAAVYLWQKPRVEPGMNTLPTHLAPATLFGGQQTSDDTGVSESNVERDNRRAALIAQARDGSPQPLQQAYALSDLELYDQILLLLTENAVSDEKLLALVSYVTRSDLPVNPSLAEAMLKSWERAPDRSSTAKTLHIVALANDAALYKTAVSSALQFWREGKLDHTSPVELKALFDGEYWLLSPEVRASGAGFLLKHTLARVRHELELAAPTNQ
jgi:hypothetical protein